MAISFHVSTGFNFNCKKSILILTLTSLLLPTSVKMKAGGISKVKPATGEIQNILDKVRSDVEKMAGRVFHKYQAISFKTQIVAGTNYFIKVLIDEDECIHVRIYETLPYDGSKLSVHSLQSNKTKDDPIKYF